MRNTDLVFPNGNEGKLAAMARRLRVRTLLLCYPADAPHLEQRRAEAQRLCDERLTVLFCVHAKDQDQVQRAVKITKEIVATGRQGIFEDPRVRYVIDFEGRRREDFVHHRNSGLTQVSIAKGIKSGKVFLVNARQLAGNYSYVILGRMMQNNMFFRKYKPTVLAVSGATEALGMRSPKDLENLLLL
jgi:RNase P/RNase MRP subunit p30